MTPEEKRRPRGMWDEDFEDISSHSRNNSITSSERGEVELPDWLNRSDEDTSSRDRRAPDWELPDWDVSSHALPERRPHAVTSSVGSTDRRPASQRKREKGRLTGVRRFLAITVVLAMTVGTLLLAAFLLFKLSEITLTGESVPGATPEKVVEVCGYEAGDNLLFLPTKAQEEAIEQAFPYVAQSEIIKHFPSTLEICLTLAPRAAVVEEAGGWVVLSPAGKVVEIGTEPPLGLLQITGVNASAEPGQLYVPEDEAVAAAFSELMAALSDRDAFTHFTRMDLSDLSDIRLVYEDRVEFCLGAALDLPYKVELGCQSVEEGVGPAEQGVLDLTSSGETKRAVFTPGVLEPAPLSPSVSAGALPTDPTAPADPGSDPAPTETPSPRDDGIPDTPFIQ